MTNVVQVAVAIITKPNGEYLLASRPHGKGWAGWWEFPGGKIEENEAPVDALTRELQEELGITPTLMQAWIKRRYDYPATHDAEAKTVALQFYFVLDWQGHPLPLEGQTLAWQHPQQLNVSPILPANLPILRALALPEVYAISNLAEMGEVKFFTALQQKLQQGLKLVQMREKQLNPTALTQFAIQVRDMSRKAGAKVFINEDIALADALGLDGVHLPSKVLLQLECKPKHLLVSASCHDATELAHAERLDLDFVTLSPVAATASHPNANPLGWHQFGELSAKTNIPIFALGGMVLDDLPLALSHGARGIAMQRTVWDVTGA